MTEKLQNIIKEELVKLPKESQEAINSIDWAKVAGEIGQKCLLNESEINDLQVETLLILIGLEDIDFYAENIENNVGTSKDEANKITEEVVNRIFTPINNFMIENIKKSGKVKEANAEQNLDFVLSGGDYSVFVNSPLEEYPTSVGGGGEIPPSPSQGEGLGVRSGEWNKPPRKMDDLRSKFTI